MSSPYVPKSGIYQHYKGPFYHVLFCGHDANYKGREVVIYFPMQFDGAHTGFAPAIRTLNSAGDYGDNDAFLDMVCRKKDCVDYGTRWYPGVPCPVNHAVKRFAYKGFQRTDEIIREALSYNVNS